MPTYQRLPRFDADYAELTAHQQRRFKVALAHFIADLEADGHFRRGLRVKRVQGTDAVMEMTFAPDGRATWQYGEPIRDGQPHIIWRRIGTHAVFAAP